MDAFRTMVIPAAQVALAREIAVTLDPAHNANMWITPLSSTGAEPATHYISSGQIPDGFASMVPCVFWAWENDAWVETGSYPGEPVSVYQSCVAAGMTVTQAQIDDLFAEADVSEQEPFVAMGRMGLQMQEPMNG